MLGKRVRHTTNHCEALLCDDSAWMDVCTDAGALPPLVVHAVLCIASGTEAGLDSVVTYLLASSKYQPTDRWAKPLRKAVDKLKCRR